MQLIALLAPLFLTAGCVLAICASDADCPGCPAGTTTTVAARCSSGRCTTPVCSPGGGCRVVWLSAEYTRCS
ncbi:hypothetical protein BKA62DRAFT_311469 [Auriculariales sp. MPI-PUGE-AT-0066]|nr:hypothetical protein BKA62DRAFT_311469 [Auriculariales sp. MPI-PUGE-AT-0066]